jgi:hypothetical protein
MCVCVCHIVIIPNIKIQILYLNFYRHFSRNIEIVINENIKYPV